MRKFNVLVLGDGAKCALIARFTQDIFLESYDPTIEEEYRRIIDVDNTLASLELLDITGAEQFTALIETSIKSSRGFVLVFSLTDLSSLREVDNLRRDIYRIKGDNKSVPIVVVGANSELYNEREVLPSTIVNLSQQWNLPFFEVSARRNWHVSDAFEDLVRQMRNRYPEHPVKTKKRLKPQCIIM